MISDQQRAAEIVERMACDAREEWSEVYAKESECYKRLEKLRRTREYVRMGDPLTIAQVLREATDPPCVSCGRPRSVGCEDSTACRIAAVPLSQQCDAIRDSSAYVCVQDVRNLIHPERWPELERLYMLELHDCDKCGGQGKHHRSNTRCVSCCGTGKQIIAGGVG